MFTRRNWFVGAVVCLIAAGGIAAGCGDDDNGGSKGDSGGAKRVNIAMVSWAYTDYSQGEEKGIKQVLADYDGGGSVKVFNANFDPQAQQKQCEDAITSGRYNAIVLVPVTPPTGVPCVKAAKAAGIPVATLEQTVTSDLSTQYELKPQVDGVVALETIPLKTQVKTSAELVKGACADKDPCKVIYETGSADDPYSKDILNGVKKALPQIDVVATFTANYDPAGVAKAMPDLLAAHPDANLYWAAADSSGVAAIRAIKEAGMADQMKIVGNGGQQVGVDAIKAGTMYGSNGNWPRQYGAHVASKLIQAVNGKEITNCCIDGLLVDKPLILTKDTVDQYTVEY
ncbi:MAG TPA: sugar ABC transporter substrate-binding protein [Baekduia sp.]|nr:sugar ABC transporter substrate-binding protein [Baekduia sp.]